MTGESGQRDGIVRKTGAALKMDEGPQPRNEGSRWTSEKKTKSRLGPPEGTWSCFILVQEIHSGLLTSRMVREICDVLSH